MAGVHHDCCGAIAGEPVRETEAEFLRHAARILDATGARTMLLAPSAITILLELVETKLSAMTLVSAGDRHRLRELERCRDALRYALRHPPAPVASVECPMTSDHAVIEARLAGALLGACSNDDALETK
jgi:hypothetical protein